MQPSRTRNSQRRRGDRVRRLRLFLGLVLCVSSLACGDDEPTVELWSEGGWYPVAVRAYAIDGQRDGRRTQAEATYTLDDGGRLTVSFDIAYDPRPELAGGRWQYDGEPPGSGDVTDLSMKFFGGQGEGPSLGGAFRLDAGGGPRFRIVVPLRPVRQPRWQQ